MSFNPVDGFVATTGALTLDDTAPMFLVDHVELQFSVEADFVAAQVANNVLILARSDGRILRIDLNKPEDIDGRFRTLLVWRSAQPAPVPSLTSLLPRRAQMSTFPRNLPRPASSVACSSTLRHRIS